MGSDLYPVIYALILYLMIYVRIAEISCAVFFFLVFTHEMFGLIFVHFD